MPEVTVIGKATFKLPDGELRSLVLLSDEVVLKVYSKSSPEDIHEKAVVAATVKYLKTQNP